MKGAVFVACLVFISTLANNAYGRSPPFERIITNEEDVYDGVTIDYSYNESSTRYRLLENGFQSVPGCPKSEEGHPWVYYGNPPRCYLAGQTSPCGWSKRLFIEEGSPYGFCGCACLEENPKPVNKTDAQFCHFKNQRHVFLPRLKNCYRLHDKGPCNEGEWIVKVEVRGQAPTTRCEKRTCPEDQIPFPNIPDKCGPRVYQESQNGVTGVAELLPNECLTFAMKYSKLLQKCIPKFNFFL